MQGVSFHVFSKGGFVVFSNARLEGNALSRLVAEHLLEERPSPEFVCGPLVLRWRYDQDLVYVVASPSVLKLPFTEALLSRLHRAVAERVGKKVETAHDFEELFQKALAKAERKAEAAREARPFEQTTPTATVAHGSPAVVSSSGEEEEEITTSGEKSVEKSPAAGQLSQEEIKKRILAKRTTKKGKGASAASSSTPSTPEKKVGRTWEGSNKKMTKKDEKSLSKSKDDDPTSAGEVGGHRVSAFTLDLEVSSDEDDDDLDESKDGGGGVKRGFFGNLLRGLTGRTLDKEDLEPVLAGLKDHLIKKNVASDVSAQLCASVQASLMGKELGSLASVSKVVTEALRVALVKILTPKRQIDILVEVEAANRQGRPFTVVFVGINGVGKSTNLAKVAAWLTASKKKVLIAACDTFRSGAVEQLGVHCRNLDIPLFQQGYGNDAAAIAQFAIRQAAKDGQDVVLIDTAGRMQDNERLMQALAKLISVNRPDLILFVGEALAGNDSVDQLTKFNQALLDWSGSEDPRLIDGIMLSKFDTVDDQVGTAVSLVYSSGLPIVFLGVGQHYADIRSFNVNAVVKALLR